MLPAWVHYTPKLPVLPKEPVTEYWIVFTESKHWSKHFLKSHFGHCYILTRDKYNWIALNPQRLLLRVEIAPYVITDDVPSIVAKDHDSIIKLTFTPRHTIQQFAWFGLLNCVTYTKYILGLRVFALTPYRLFKKLLTLTNYERMEHCIIDVQLIKG